MWVETVGASPPHIIVHLGYPPRRPPLCYPRLLSLPLIIKLSLTWVAWVASFLADFGVVSGRKRQIMLPTALFWTVGSAPLQVWTSPFCRKTRHLCSTRRFLQKNLQVGSFFALCMLFQGPPGGPSGRTRDLQTRLGFALKFLGSLHSHRRQCQIHHVILPDNLCDSSRVFMHGQHPRDLVRSAARNFRITGDPRRRVKDTFFKNRHAISMGSVQDSK